MIAGQSNLTQLANTPPQAVVPFFAYGSISFMIACAMSFFSANDLIRHYLNPQIISLTHIMALGWVTMIIFGAAHQLLPVLIESGIYSHKLVYLVFILSAIAIPVLVISFYRFDMGYATRIAAISIVLAIAIFLFNTTMSIYKSKTENIHAIYVFTSAVWLLITGVSGFLQVYNFASVLLDNNSFYYLPFHAISGICGWFLLLIIGIGSRLIPMFLISKYSNTKLLWTIFILINSGLIIFIYLFLNSYNSEWFYIPVSIIIVAVALFGFFCLQSFRQRIRKAVEPQLLISLISVASLMLPLILIIISQSIYLPVKLISLYGFLVFFMCLSLLIMGMTFKTLPFIIWNKIYGKLAGKFQTPSPKELYSSRLFNYMAILYGIAIAVFTSGILFSSINIIKVGAVLMFISSVLYNFNVFKIIFHKPTFS